MVGDLRARAKLRDFFLQWLKVDQAGELSKDNAQYPDFNATVAADLRTSLELFVDEVMWSERSDFRQLFTSDAVPMNCCLKKFYGVDPPESESSASTVDDSAYGEVAARSGSSLRRADASVPVGHIRPCGDQFADSSGRVHFAKSAGPRALQAAAGGDDCRLQP